MEAYFALREKYPVFRFLSYDMTETKTALDITYHFEIEGLSAFHPHWSFPKSDRLPLCENTDTLREMVFSLGMVELVSYWKITCSPRVEVLAGALDANQVAWWKRLYFHGLGEFFYRNGIAPDADDFMQMISLGERTPRTVPDTTAFSGCLVPVGGGKDSVVTLELLREQRDSNYCYIINPRGATRATAEQAGYPPEHILTAARTLDPAMLECNRQGFLNGHTPFSAIVAFSGLITAYLHRLRYIVLSNESSANESTVAGSTVNHQYSKSYAFERDFQQYQTRYIGTDILYFSLLRPLSEYQIAALFANMQAYHRIFRSCNVGSKQDVWCGHCPKCLFVFLILSPFLPHDYLCDIFGRDMTEDETLLTVFEQLVGILPEKPFECVGSRQEVNTAVARTVCRMEAEHEPLPLLFRYYRSTPLFEQYAAAPDVYATHFDEENLLPPAFRELVYEKSIGR